MRERADNSMEANRTYPDQLVEYTPGPSPERSIGVHERLPYVVERRDRNSAANQYGGCVSHPEVRGTTSSHDICHQLLTYEAKT